MQAVPHKVWAGAAYHALYPCRKIFQNTSEAEWSRHLGCDPRLRIPYYLRGSEGDLIGIVTKCEIRETWDHRVGYYSQQPTNQITQRFFVLRERSSINTRKNKYTMAQPPERTNPPIKAALTRTLLLETIMLYAR